MKYFTITFILLGIVLSAHAELTSDDLLKISEIVNKAVKDSETRMKEYVDIKFDGFEKQVNEQFKSVDKQFEHIDKRLTHQSNITYALIALIIFAIGLPAWRDRKDRKLEAQLQKQIEALTQRIETLENVQIQNPSVAKGDLQ